MSHSGLTISHFRISIFAVTLCILLVLDACFDYLTRKKPDSDLCLLGPYFPLYELHVGYALCLCVKFVQTLPPVPFESSLIFTKWSLVLTTISSLLYTLFFFFLLLLFLHFPLYFWHLLERRFVGLRGEFWLEKGADQFSDGILLSLDSFRERERNRILALKKENGDLLSPCRSCWRESFSATWVALQTTSFLLFRAQCLPPSSLRRRPLWAVTWLAVWCRSASVMSTPFPRILILLFSTI